MSRLLVLLAALFLPEPWRSQKRNVWLIELRDAPWGARLRFSLGVLWGVGQTRSRLAGNLRPARVSLVQAGLVVMSLAVPALALSSSLRFSNHLNLLAGGNTIATAVPPASLPPDIASPPPPPASLPPLTALPPKLPEPRIFDNTRTIPLSALTSSPPSRDLEGLAFGTSLVPPVGSPDPSLGIGGFADWLDNNPADVVISVQRVDGDWVLVNPDDGVPLRFELVGDNDLLFFTEDSDFPNLRSFQSLPQPLPQD